MQKGRIWLKHCSILLEKYAAWKRLGLKLLRNILLDNGSTQNWLEKIKLEKKVTLTLKIWRFFKRYQYYIHQLIKHYIPISLYQGAFSYKDLVKILVSSKVAWLENCSKNFSSKMARLKNCWKMFGSKLDSAQKFRLKCSSHEYFGSVPSLDHTAYNLHGWGALIVMPCRIFITA